MSLLLFVGQTAPILGNPTGGAVVAGAATIGPAGKTLNINQTSGAAIINWQQFSIANGEATKFFVPNSASSTLNRVTGGNPSAIYGSLSSNGRLYLVNPSGIVVGPSGRIDTASFLASTLDVSSQQFLAGGNLSFAGNSSAGIDNQGVIHASSGDVYLIANQVNNAGTLSAPKGTVGLAAGSDVLFQQSGSQHLFVQATPAGTKRAVGLNNSGTVHAAAAELKAAGGNAYALAINNTGLIAASGYKKINGQVYLTSDGGNITNSGTISARTAKGNGGTIVMDASASTAIRSGTVTNSGTLIASATVAGGVGGSITFKSKAKGTGLALTGTAIDTGTIIAHGGTGGVGGNVDVSGANLTFTGKVDLTAPGGKTGNLLIDPTTLDVIIGGTGTIVSGQNDSTSSSIDPLVVEANLATANITLNADDSISVDSPITWTSANTLTLSTNVAGASATTISINAAITGASGGLTIDTAGMNDMIVTGSAGDVSVGKFILQSGFWNQNSNVLPYFSAETDFEVQGGTFLRASGGTGTSGSPYQITDIYGLQGIGSPSGNLLADTFELVNDITGSTYSWDANAGFKPIGSNTAPFAGTLDGQGYLISDLSISRAGQNYIGLLGDIGSAGVVKNFGVVNPSITGDYNVGAIAGENDGTIEGVYYLGGNIEGEGSTYAASASDIGGLVGLNAGSLSDSYSAGSVYTYSSSSGLIGGAVGYNSSGTINRVYSSTAVSAYGGNNVGGFCGYNSDLITNSFWDTTTSGQTSGIGLDNHPGTTTLAGDATATLLNKSTYTAANWNIGTDPTTNTWVILDGQTRPLLAWEYRTVISNAHQLQLIGLNATTLGASYTTTGYVDTTGVTNASDVWGTTTTNGGAGFAPIGGSSNFTGTLNGLYDPMYGYLTYIDDLYINRPSSNDVGLFAGTSSSALIENLTLEDATITGGSSVGTLVGQNFGTITNASVLGYSGFGTLTGTGSVGGLVGNNEGQINSSTTTGMTVMGQSYVGGLAGYSSGSVTTSFASDTVTGTGNSLDVGGLVGDSAPGGSISASYSTSTVSGDQSVGGLVGINNSGSTITTSYSAGSVMGTSNVGGLVGYNSGGMISNSYSVSTVGGGNGTTYGGFVGENLGTITTSYSSGQVSATGGGGFVGDNSAGTITHSFWDSTTSGESVAAGAGSGAGATGDPTATLLNESTYAGAGWSIGTDLTSDTWVIFDGQTRPLLSMEYSTSITNAHQLQLIGLNSTTLSATYNPNYYNYSSGTIDLSGTSNASDIWGTSTSNSGKGFVPIGTSATPFSGTFEQYSTLTSLYIDRPGQNDVGLFGVVNGVLEDISLTNTDVVGSSNVGGLVGALGNDASGTSGSGSLVLCSSSGTVFGLGSYVGGLVGLNHGTQILSSSSGGTVSGADFVGGLVGSSLSVISDDYSTANVSASGGPVGGLVGENFTGGTVHNTYSSGTVAGSSEAGALVGRNLGTIDNSFWNTTSSGIASPTGGVGSGTNSGVIGATSTQLSSENYILTHAPVSPTWDFADDIWTVSDGSLPMLEGTLYQSNGTSSSTLTGTAFTDNGVTDAGSGLTVDLIFDGSLLGSTTTNSSGLFSFTLNSNDLIGGILLTDVTDNGNTFYQADSPSSTIAGIDIWGSTLRIVGDEASNTALGNAAGNLTGAGINYTVTTPVSTPVLATNNGVNLSILSANYSLDGNVSANGSLTTSASSTLTATSNVVLSGDSMNLAGSLASTGEITINSNGTVQANGDVAVDGFYLENGIWIQIVGFDGLTSLPTFTNTGDFRLGNSSEFARFAGGDGSSGNPYQITDVFGLQGIGSPGGTLAADNFILNNTIDASGTSGWNGGAGFSPIGISTAFSGTFDGGSFAINGLTIDTPAVNDVGLFGLTGSSAIVKNVVITSASVTGNNSVALLIGDNSGMVLDSSVDGNVNGSEGTGGQSSDVGGLVGTNEGPGIIEGNVSLALVGATTGVTNYVGGLVGLNDGLISDDYSIGAVYGSSGGQGVGGLVGYNYLGTISDAYSTGAVTGANNVGGLVGSNVNQILNTFSTGTVTGDNGGNAVGGLVGANIGGTVANSYTLSPVTISGSSTDTGAYVGESSGTLKNGFWDTSIAGSQPGVGGGATGGAVGGTTAQLESQNFITSNSSASPNWDFSNVWSTQNDTNTPQLRLLPAVNPPAAAMNTLSGIAYTDQGGTRADDTLIDLIFGGAVLGSTTTDSSGDFSFDLSAADLMSGVLLTDPADNGNSYYQANIPATTISGVYIWGNTIRVMGDVASNTALATVAGGSTANGIQYTSSGTNLTVNNLVDLRIYSTNYTLDGNLSLTGVLLTDAASNLIGTANSTIAANTIFLNGAVNTTGTVTLQPLGNVYANGNVAVGGFILQSGYWDQIVGQNSLTTLPTFTDSGDFENNGGTFQRFAGGDGSTGNPYQVTDVYGLQGIGSTSTALLTDSFVLNGNIDATATSGWNGGAGFVPIGTYISTDGSSGPSTYSGTFNGQGNTINGLFIDLPGNSDGTGLFGDTASASTLENLHLTNVNVTGDTYTGGATGVGNATTSNVTVSGTVTGGSYTGGLYGISSNVISNSSSAGTVASGSETSDLGGLVGYVQFGSITGSSSTATINAGASTSSAGGLVGDDDGSIMTSFASGTVNDQSGIYAGGLVGELDGGSVTDSYSTGAVYGGGSTGGLIGYAAAGTVNAVYASGAVRGYASDVGGLIGYNTAMVTNAFSTGAVSSQGGGSEIGGLIGFNGVSVQNTYTTSAVTPGTGAINVGALVGLNDGTLKNSFYDLDFAGSLPGVGLTSGGGSVATSGGGTTAQLETENFYMTQATSTPTFDFANTFMIVSGNTPQLVGLAAAAAPAAPSTDLLSGTAYVNSGTTVAYSGTLIDLLFDGAVIGSTTTNGSGGFSFNITPTDLTGGILLVDGNDNGNTFYQANAPAGTITGIDIWGNTLRVMADTASNAALATTGGNASGAVYTVSGGALQANTNALILSHYTLDGNITAYGTFTAASGAILNGSQNVTLTGSSIFMGGTFNTTGSLAFSAPGGEIDFETVGASGAPATAQALSLSAGEQVIVNNSSLATTGGDFTASGNGTAANLTGVNLTNSNIDTDGGSYSLTGTGTSFDGSSGMGVVVDNSLLVTHAGSENATSGNVVITGTTTVNGSVESDLFGTQITHSVITTVDGNITVSGTISSGTTTGNLAANEVDNASAIHATGTGALTFNGDSSNASGAYGAFGVRFDQASLVSAVDASGVGVSGINVTGTAGSLVNAVADATVSGVAVLGGSQLSASGSAPITLTGTGGTDTTADTSLNTSAGGVFLTSDIDGVTSSITTNTGAITVTGTAGASARFSYGVNGFGPNGGAAVISSNAGDITISGSMPSTTFTSNQLDAVVFQTGASVSTQDGAIDLEGTVGSGAATGATDPAARGVFLYGGTVSATGEGSITLNGQITSGTIGSYAMGGTLIDNETISSLSGGISIQGTASSPSMVSGDLYGVRVQGSSTIEAQDGLISVTGQVTAGTGTAATGVNILGGSTVAATGGAGSINLNGTTAGATSLGLSTGVAIHGSETSVSASGTGGVSITGTAGTIAAAAVAYTDPDTGIVYDPSSSGIAVSDGAGVSTSGAAPITLHGTGGNNLSTFNSGNGYVDASTGGTLSSHGVIIYSPTSGETTTVASGGTLTITGTAGSSPISGTGVTIGGTRNAGNVSVTSANGAISITGTGGAGNTTGSASPNAGVAIFDPGNNTGSASVTAHGGALNITGAAGAGTTQVGVNGAPFFGGSYSDPVDSSGTASDPVISSDTALNVTSLAGSIDLSGAAGGLDAPSISITTPSGTSSNIPLSGGSGLVSLTGGDYTVTEYYSGGTFGPVNVTNLSVSQDAETGFAYPATTFNSVSTGSLTVDALGVINLNGAISASGPVILETTGGNINFGAGGSIFASGAGNNVILAAGTNLANSRYIINHSNAGANTIQVANGAYFDLYSADPTYDSLGAITVPANNMVFNAVYTTTGLPPGNQELFYVASASDVGPNAPVTAPPPPVSPGAPTGSPNPTGGNSGQSSSTPSTETGGAAGAGSNIVPPALTPQTQQVVLVSSTSANSANQAGTQQEAPFNFIGTGASAYLGFDAGGLANSSGNSGQVTSGDTAQMNDGQLNNVANPAASRALNQALGPAVYRSLAEALQDVGDWTATSEPSGGDQTAGAGGSDQEVILGDGDVAEIGDSGVKSIPPGQAPKQLQNALSNSTLQGMNSGAGH